MNRVLAGLVLIGCAAPAPASDPRVDRLTQSARYRLDLRLDPDPPVLGELFAVEVVVRTADGTPLETAVVKADARMPQHGHGMETRPRTRPCEDPDSCRYPGGRYPVDGFKFHMAGPWTVTVDVEGPKGPDSTSFVYVME